MAWRRHGMTGVIVCLVLGAVVSLEVAAVCAVWSKTDYRWRAHRIVATGDTRVSTSDGVDIRETSAVESRMDVLARLIDARSPSFRRAGRAFQSFRLFGGRGVSVEILSEGRDALEKTMQVFHAGWPWPCLGAMQTTPLWQLQPNPWESAVEIPSWLRPARREHSPVLPLNIQWGGLALDTLLFGGLLWGAAFGWRLARAWRRRRRGCCLECGYSLDGLEGRCPECGLERRSRRQQMSSSGIQEVVQDL